MAHHTEQVGFPALALNGGMQVRLRALSPTTDAAITGVTCTLWALYGRDESEGPPIPPEPVEWLALPTSG